MVALNFKDEFAIAVIDGEKRRSIRPVRKKGNPSVGCALQLYTGMRTQNCTKLIDAICTRVTPVVIDHMGVEINGRRLYAGDAPAYQGGESPSEYDGDFARADGFGDFGSMLDFFEGIYGLPFSGQIIEWKAA